MIDKVEESIVVEEILIVEQKKIIETENIQHSTLATDISANKPKKELPKQSSLSAIYKELHQEVKSNTQETKIDLTITSVEELWQDFLKDNRSKLQNAFLSVAEKQVPQLIEDRITFIETNNISLELLQLHKTDIVGYYTKKTTSSMIHLDFKLDRKKQQNKSYKTPKDRLKDMMINNPAVLKLIEKFDLNMD